MSRRLGSELRSGKRASYRRSALSNWSDFSLANPRTELNITAPVEVTANFALLPTAMQVVTAPANGEIDFTESAAGMTRAFYRLVLDE